jgi:hypothetical protein
MATDQAPWQVVEFDRGVAFYCPECFWRVETFAANSDGQAHQLPDNTPASVIAWMRGAR